MFTPSEILPDLSDERVDEIGMLIYQTRQENITFSDERDDGWSLGCRGYSWCRSEICDLSKKRSWLTVINPNLKFVFKIGNVEVCFYKGSSTKPKKNIYSRAQSYPEIQQLPLLGNDLPASNELIWAFAVETDAEGYTTNVEFFGMTTAGEIVASRRVPIHRIDAHVPADLKQKASESVHVQPAKVSLASAVKKKASNDNEREDGV